MTQFNHSVRTCPPDSWNCSSSTVLCLLIITILIFGIILLFFQKKLKNSCKNKSLLKKPKPDFLTQPYDYHCSSSTKSAQEIQATIDDLYIELGQYEALAFLELCIQELTQITKKLEQHIDNNDLLKAKVITHRLFGASNLFASMNLRQLFINIDSNILTEDGLEQAFLDVQLELSLVLNYMKKKLIT